MHSENDVHVGPGGGQNLGKKRIHMVWKGGQGLQEDRVTLTLKFFQYMGGGMAGDGPMEASRV